MQVSVETTQGLERRVTITVPADAIDSEVKRLLKEEYRHRRVNGFRKGKIPPNVLQKMFGREARSRAASSVMQSKYFEAVMQEKLNPAGAPARTRQRKSLSGGCSSVGRAPDCDSGCRGFKSHHPPHFFISHY